MKILASELKSVLDVFATSPSGSSEGAERNVFFTGKEIKFYRGEAFFEKDFESGIEGGVDFEILFNIIGKYGNDEISIERVENNLIIKKGRSVSKIPATDEISVPKIKFEGDDVEWRSIPSDFHNLLNTASAYCDSSNGEIAKSVIHIHRRYIESSDGIRFGIFKMKGNIDDSLFIQKDFSKPICKFEPSEYALSDSWLLLKNSNGYRFAIRKLDIPEYPDLKGIYANCKTDTVVTIPDELINSLEKSEVFLKAELPTDKFVEIVADGGNLTLMSETKIGKYKDEIACDEGLSMSFKVNPSYLLDMIMFSNEIYIGESSICCETGKAKLATGTVI